MAAGGATSFARFFLHSNDATYWTLPLSADQIVDGVLAIISEKLDVPKDSFELYKEQRQSDTMG